MTQPRSVADVLASHVLFELEAIDCRASGNQPVLAAVAAARGVAALFVGQRGHRFPYSALIAPMTAALTADIDHFVAAHGLDLVQFAKGSARTTCLCA